PTVTAPADVSASTDPNSCTASLNPGTAAGHDNCAGVTVSGVRSDGQPLDAAYPKGVTTITWTATDAAGNASVPAQQSVTVVDDKPPTITAPPSVTAYTGAGAQSCDAFVSNATLGTASASDNCAGVTVSRSPAGNTFPVGTTDVTWTATDAAGNTATAHQSVTVIDNTAPVVTAPANITAGNDLGSCSATLNPGAATATDNCAGVSTPVGVRSDGQPLNAAYPKGTTTITWRATDAHGNSGSATQTVTVNDTEKPVVNVPANIVVTLPANSTATSMTVSYSVTATDNCPGVSFTVNPVSGSTFSVGTTTVTATATDASGNVTTRTFTVTVLYNFTGFFSPVVNLPTLNVVNSGRAVPVKFSLSGNKSLNIFLAGSPDSQLIACDTGAPLSDLQDTVTAGGSSLSYDASSDQYSYVWKTDATWAGTCRQLVLGLNDGSARVAKFKFK
ncbi:MAG: PxKF domain-containing protein, partial [Acidobacteria bacterium]|nr:PxKF domain-containing protein [Acidobacteriota bacterium]